MNVKQGPGKTLRYIFCRDFGISLEAWTEYKLGRLTASMHCAFAEACEQIETQVSTIGSHW